MKFNLFILPTVPGTYQERRKLRPIARNNDRYQQMLQELRDIAVLAEDLGFDALSTTEHHFHSEGYETSDFAEAYRFGKEIMNGGWIPYFGGFSFFEAFRFPGETTPVPLPYDRMIEAKYALVGTVDDVKRDVEQLHRDTNAEWFGWYFDQGLMSWDETRRQLESFATIIREFRD